MSLSKGRLAVLLSTLPPLQIPSVQEEQYQTDAETAAEVLSLAMLLGDITGKRVLDLGCGAGLLGLGAALLDAREVIAIERDERLIKAAESNRLLLREEAGRDLDNIRFVSQDIAAFSGRGDTVLQNPPFGTRVEHADRAFLAKAFSIADVVWSFHKESTSGFVERFAEDSGFLVTHHLSFDFPLKATMRHHTRRIRRIGVGCWRLVRGTPVD